MLSPEERIKVKVSHLRVNRCSGNPQPIAAIHPQYLHTLAVDFFADEDQSLCVSLIHSLLT